MRFRKIECRAVVRRRRDAGGLVKLREILMKKIIDYIKAVRAEWFKITWPPRDTVVRSVIMILIFSGLVALFLFAVDRILSAIVGWVF